MKALAEKNELPEAAIHKTKITWEECDLFAYQLTCLNFVNIFFKFSFTTTAVTWYECSKWVLKKYFSFSYKTSSISKRLSLSR